jgi:dihydrofolate reductase
MYTDLKTNASYPVVIVAAMSSKQRVIGRHNELLWHAPTDLQRFKELTLGHPIIMGRKTFASILAILGKPLPQRHTIVLTRDQDYHYDGVSVVHSLAEAFARATLDNPQEIHIGGGAELYEQALPFTDRLHLTLWHDEPVGDAFFPPYENDFIEIERFEPQTHKGITFSWVDFERR